MTDNTENGAIAKKNTAKLVLNIYKYGGLPFTVFLGIAVPMAVLLIIAASSSWLIAGVVFLVGVPVFLFAGAVTIQVLVPLYSFVHILLRLILKKKLKRKPVAIIFRVITVLFAITALVFVGLLATKIICGYDFLRSFAFFTGGLVVLNLCVE